MRWKNEVGKMKKFRFQLVLRCFEMDKLVIILYSKYDFVLSMVSPCFPIIPKSLASKGEFLIEKYFKVKTLEKTLGWFSMTFGLQCREAISYTLLVFLPEDFASGAGFPAYQPVFPHALHYWVPTLLLRQVPPACWLPNYELRKYFVIM